MQIRRLQVSNVRNLSRIALSEFKRINIFFGLNGGGKTSLLESVHLLLTGKSFRQTQLRPLLTEGQDQSIIFAELESIDWMKTTLGMSRQRDGSKPAIKCNGENVSSVSELVKIAPIQVLSADSLHLLTGGPAFRRQFLDWGLFHVEPSFYPIWKLAQRALKQRNGLIRHGKIARDQLLLWTREYARYGEQIDTLRQAYLEHLLPACRETINTFSLSIADRLEITYSRGWQKNQALEEALMQGIDSDLQQGHTRLGPHRADLRIVAGAHLAGETLSRGQLKALVACFHLAQAQLLQAKTAKKSIFLVDDLAAELDEAHLGRFCAALERLEVQVLTTSIKKNELMDYWSQRNEVQMFHVEQGQVTAAS
jgi:DNA replication and repair protein RecF